MEHASHAHKAAKFVHQQTIAPIVRITTAITLKTLKIALLALKIVYTVLRTLKSVFTVVKVLH